MHGSDLRGLLHPLLLLLIRERPGHGYDLAVRLSGLGLTQVESGHVYRVLRSLERDGLVASEWTASDSGPARRRYALTPAGLADLEASMSRLGELDLVIGACLERWRQACANAAVPHPNGRHGQPVNP
jgi:PadR family transcriptional regulator, regulatory protein PadR